MIIATVTLVYNGGDSSANLFVTTVATEHTNIDLFGSIIEDEYKEALFQSLSQEFKDEFKEEFFKNFLYMDYAVEVQETPIINARADNARSTFAACIAELVQETRENIQEEGYETTEEFLFDIGLTESLRDVPQR